MFTINGIEWELCFVDPYSHYLRRSDNTITLGVTDNNELTVYINNKLRGRLLTKVVTHEIVHTICFSYGCDFSIETEEIIADWVATYGRTALDVLDDLLHQKRGVYEM